MDGGEYRRCRGQNGHIRRIACVAAGGDHDTGRADRDISRHLRHPADRMKSHVAGCRVQSYTVVTVASTLCLGGPAKKFRKRAS